MNNMQMERFVNAIEKIAQDGIDVHISVDDASFANLTDAVTNGTSEIVKSLDDLYDAVERID